MTTPETNPARREYRLKAPLIQAGVELATGDTVWLRADQAERLAAHGTVDIEAPAKPGRATKQEG